METHKTQTKWIIDAVLFTGFIVVLLLDLTGLALHQWLGIAIGALALYHLINHWSWVTNVTERFFGRTSPNARLYYLMDAGLLLEFVLILVTGLVISTWFSSSLSNYAAWKNVHILISIAALLLIVVKIGFHWHWIVQVARRSIFSPWVSDREERLVQHAHDLRSSGRRDFLKLMGVVSGAAFFAVGNALDGLEGITGSEIVSSQQTSVQDPLSTSVKQNNSTNLNSASVCSTACNRSCSYPGHCHRYVDNNGNQRCDLGECA